jgi:hypothetical protein
MLNEGKHNVRAIIRDESKSAAVLAAGNTLFYSIHSLIHYIHIHIHIISSYHTT